MKTMPQNQDNKTHKIPSFQDFIEGKYSEQKLQDILNTPTANDYEKPRSGIYGNPDVYRAYMDLLSELNDFIPDHLVGLHISGTASMARAKAEAIVMKSKILQSKIKAVCQGRK